MLPVAETGTAESVAYFNQADARGSISVTLTVDQAKVTN